MASCSLYHSVPAIRLMISFEPVLMLARPRSRSMRSAGYTLVRRLRAGFVVDASYARLHRIDATTADRVRLVISGARGAPAIRAFGLYRAGTP